LARSYIIVWIESINLERLIPVPTVPHPLPHRKELTKPPNDVFVDQLGFLEKAVDQGGAVRSRNPFAFAMQFALR
jgi:hypothetical protein